VKNWVTVKAPKTLVLKTSWKTGRGWVSLSGRTIPALFIRMSMWPYFSLMEEAAEVIEESSVTSNWMGSTEQPSFLSSAAAVSPLERVRHPIRTW